MGTLIILAIMIFILIGLIFKLVKKTREVRASFRNTFGGGPDKTIENAQRKLTENSKGNVIPAWAISDAASEMAKYNMVESKTETELEYRKNLMNQGFDVVEIPKSMMMAKNSSKSAAVEAIKQHLSSLSVKYYIQHHDLSNKDKVLIKNCSYMYYFAVTDSNMKEAEDAVNFLVNQWKINVDGGKQDTREFVYEEVKFETVEAASAPSFDANNMSKGQKMYLAAVESSWLKMCESVKQHGFTVNAEMQQSYMYVIMWITDTLAAGIIDGANNAVAQMLKSKNWEFMLNGMTWDEFEKAFSVVYNRIKSKKGQSMQELIDYELHLVNSKYCSNNASELQSLIEEQRAAVLELSVPKLMAIMNATIE